MYVGENICEYVSVIGTPAFMEFVESIQNEGVELETGAMGKGARPKSPVVVEVDTENTKKDLDALDIQLPRLMPRIYRNYKNLLENRMFPLSSIKKSHINNFQKPSSGKSFFEI